MFRPGDRPVLNLDLPPGVALERAAQDARADPRPERGERSTRTTTSSPPASTPTTWRSRCRPRRPAVFDLSSETAGDARPVRHRQGADATTTAGAACWPAGWSRRACGSSCVVSGGGPGNMQWDAHDDIEENHLRMAARDRQAGRRRCCKDLKRRGLLDSTLVLWGGEFGRSPEAARRQGPRPPQPRLHDVDGRRRHQGRPGRRRHRRHRPCARRWSRTTSATSTPRSCTSSGSTRTR